ncbi:MAG: hypothetical protein IT252_07690 [Chitinophagaceae bacterium]|nr:hypothetical protein [Chitinophagaceae bacterium]
MRFAIVFLTILIAEEINAQKSLFLHTYGPDPSLFARSVFHRSVNNPVPIQKNSITIGDSLTLNHYYEQYFVLTDTTKANKVIFSILTGYDGTSYWMAFDTNYDGHYNDEVPYKINLPEELAEAMTGERIGGEVIQVSLHSYRITDSLLHPPFYIFVQPTFQYSFADKRQDNIIINASLIAGYKAASQIELNNHTMQMAIQLYPFTPALSLFEYYSMKHQQMGMFNLLRINNTDRGKLVSYINAFDFLIKKKSWNVEEMSLTVIPDSFNFKHNQLFFSVKSVHQSVSENLIAECDTLIAKHLKTEKPFVFGGTDSLVFYFTGSWCAPCRVLTPQVEEYYKYLPEGWKGYVVANEHTFKDASTYLNKFQFEQAYFEPLRTTSACSLREIFSIGVYPTVVYTTPQGKVLWIGQGLRDSIRF